MERLMRQVSEARRALPKASEDWKKAVNAVEGLADAFEALGSDESLKDAARQLLPIAADIGLQVNSSRSAAVRDTCKSVARILAVAGRYFSDVANALMPSVAATAKGSSAAIRTPGADLFARMSELTRYDLQLLKSIYLKDKAHERVCTLLLEQLSVVFVYWTQDEVRLYFSDITAVIDAGLHSGSEFTRRAARDAACALTAFWPSRFGELRDIPPQQQVRLILENPDSRVATALLEKHADLADKVQRFQLLEIKKPPVRPRGSSQRSSTSSRRETGDLSAALRGRKTSGSIVSRLSASSDSSSGVSAKETKQPPAADRPQPVAKQAVEDDVEAEAASSLDFKRMMDDPVAVDIRDDGLAPHVPPEFDGSQMHGFTLGQSEPQVESQAREDVPSSQAQLDKAPSGVGAQRPSVRAPNESRIPRRVPPRSSSIALPTPRIRSEPPASRITLPPIEFSGLSVSSSTIQDAERVDTAQIDAETMAPPLENVSISSEPCDPGAATVTDRDSWEEDVTVESPLTAPYATEERRHEATAADSTTQEWQEPPHDVEAGPNLDSGVVEDNLDTSTTRVVAPPPKGALERLQEVRQQYADLRSISRFDAHDFSADPSPEVLVDEYEVAAVQSYPSAEFGELEGIDAAKTPEAKLQAIEPATLASVAHEVAPTLSVKPRAPYRDADTCHSRRSTVTSRRDRSQNRSRESSRERHVESGERGGNPTAAVRERPLVRKKSIPNLLKGVRLTFEDKPTARLPFEGDAALPRTNQDPIGFEVPAVAARIVDAALYLPELPVPAALDETGQRDTSVDEDFHTPMGVEPLSIPTHCLAAVRARHKDDSNAAKLTTKSTAKTPDEARPPPINTSAVDRSPPSTGVEHARPPRASLFKLVQEEDMAPTKQPHRLASTPTKSRWGFPASVWTSASTIWFWLLLGLLFGGSGLLRAVSTIRETYEYHQALKLRVDRFEASVAESHETVHKLEENYAVWSEYVRVLAEEDEADAVAHLESIQHEVEKWQRDMKADLLEFRRSLAAEGVDAVLAPVLRNATQGE